jgi:hypothetical protein
MAIRVAAELDQHAAARWVISDLQRRDRKAKIPHPSSANSGSLAAIQGPGALIWPCGGEFAPK